MSERSRRIGLLFRGDRSGPRLVGRAQVLSDAFDAFEAFDELGVEVEPVVYSDDAVDEVREQVRSLDGVLVWVNPIQDGANRAQLDALLHEVSESGVWVSAHPDVILAMETKEVLHPHADARLGDRHRPVLVAGDVGPAFPRPSRTRRRSRTETGAWQRRQRRLEGDAPRTQPGTG